MSDLIKNLIQTEEGLLEIIDDKPVAFSDARVMQHLSEFDDLVELTNRISAVNTYALESGSEQAMALALINDPFSDGVVLSLEAAKKSNLGTFDKINTLLQKLWISVKKWWNDFNDKIPSLIKKLSNLEKTIPGISGIPRVPNLKVSDRHVNRLRYADKLDHKSLVAGLKLTHKVVETFIDNYSVESLLGSDKFSAIFSNVELERGMVLKSLSNAYLRITASTDAKVLEHIEGVGADEEVPPHDFRLCTTQEAKHALQVRTPSLLGQQALFIAVGFTEHEKGGEYAKIVPRLITDLGFRKFAIQDYDINRKAMGTLGMKAMSKEDMLVLVKLALTLLRKVEMMPAMTKVLDKAALDVSNEAKSLHKSASGADIDSNELTAVNNFCTNSTKAVSKLNPLPIKVAGYVATTMETLRLVIKDQVENYG